MTSTTWVSWIITCECQPSSFEAISDLAAEMSTFFYGNEPETTHFEWSATADQSTVFIHERYSNSDQALEHMSAFGEQFGSRFMELLKPVSVVVHGYPSTQLSAALAGLSPVFTESFAGFHR